MEYENIQKEKNKNNIYDINLNPNSNINNNSNNENYNEYTEINIDNITSKQLKELYKKYKKDIAQETKTLKTELYNNNYDETQFKTLRLYLLDNFKTTYKQYLTLFMLKLMFIIYYNKNNKYNILKNIMYNNNYNRIIIGMDKNLYLEIFPRENPEDISTENTDYFPQNNQVFMSDISSISTGRTTATEVFNRFIKQYQNNEHVFDKKLQNLNNNLFCLTENTSNLITKYYNEMITPVKSNTTQEQEDEEIENIHSYQEYKDKYNLNQLLKLNELTQEPTETDNIYIPHDKIKLHNLYTLINKYGEFEFKFLLSPKVENHTFNNNTQEEIITRTKIKIIEQDCINPHENENIISKLKYICPGCNTLVYLNPNDLLTEITHICDITTNTKTKILANKLTPAIKKTIYLYKCNICTNYKDTINNNTQPQWINDIYIHSFNNNIKNGIYITDIVKIYEQTNCLNKTNKDTNTYLMFGYKKEKIKYTEDKIIKTQQEIEKILENPNIPPENKYQLTHLNNIYKNKKLPEHKILNILYSIRQYYHNAELIKIDNNGLLLQIMTLITTIAKLCFNENKIAISVMGVGSVSKTFPTLAITRMIDNNTKYISDSSRMSAAGMTGGMNMSATINNTTTKKFEKGAISTDGIVIFDECQNIFLRPDIQSIIKSIPQDEYEVSVIGGKKIKYNCTPIFLSNFNEFSEKYEQTITDAFITKYKSIYKFEQQRTHKTNQDMKKYLSLINMYQNIEYYMETLQDEILANVIFAVRKQYENKRIDWKTGSQLEAMNRILFDIVIHRKDNKINYGLSHTLQTNENTKEINPNTNAPTQQIQEEIIKYIYNQQNLENIQKINTKEYTKNPTEKIQQLEKLRTNTIQFLNNETLGININKYFTQNVDNFDKKILELVIKTIIILQLIDNINATQLSENTKKLANIILLKCKRGIIQEEYNMDINVNEIKIYKNLQKDYLNDMEDIKTELYYNEKIKDEQEKIEKEIENKYLQEKIEKIEKTDNSLNNITIKIPEIETTQTETQTQTPTHKIEITEEKRKIEYDKITMCLELGCNTTDENTQTETIKKYKKNGIIYEPKNGVYKYV